jgi:hypothetical protein
MMHKNRLKELTFFVVKPEFYEGGVFHEKCHCINGIEQLQQLTKVGAAECNYYKCVEYDANSWSAKL